ncbi:hypothetical protein ABS828_20840, partial [Klebsiella pneumoniae]
LLCHGTVCVVGKMRDLILQLSKSSIYSTKPFPGFQNEYILRTAINLFAKIRANKSFDKDDEKTLKRLSGFKYNLEEKDPNYDLITALESMKVIYG